MDTKQIEEAKWGEFYLKWADFLHKAREAADEVLSLEAGIADNLVLSMSREVWDALSLDLADMKTTPESGYLNSVCVQGIQLRRIHKEVINQLVIQDRGVVLVARLFNLPSDIDKWGKEEK